MKSRLQTKTGALTATGVAVVAFLGTWEGLRLNAYQDVVKVWTICYGETKGVKPGDKYTKPECDQQLVTTLIRDYEPGVQKCIGEAAAVSAPDGLYLSMIEGAYNYGVGAFCKSTAADRAKLKDFAGACTALTWYNKAGGKVWKGLQNRRKAAYDICMGGLPGVKPEKLTRSRTALSVDAQDKPVAVPFEAAKPLKAPTAPATRGSCILWWCW